MGLGNLARETQNIQWKDWGCSFPFPEAASDNVLEVCVRGRLSCCLLRVIIQEPCWGQRDTSKHTEWLKAGLQVHELGNTGTSVISTCPCQPRTETAISLCKLPEGLLWAFCGRGMHLGSETLCTTYESALVWLSLGAFSFFFFFSRQIKDPLPPLHLSLRCSSSIFSILDTATVFPSYQKQRRHKGCVQGQVANNAANPKEMSS